MLNLVSANPRQLGEFEVGPLAFGCWRFTNTSVEETGTLLDEALDLGMNLVDTADVYGVASFGENEAMLGQVLAADPARRRRMVLASKGGIIPPTPYDSGPGYLVKACEASLRRLGVDTIDLYQIHRPDLFTHPAEVAGTLLQLRAAGKIVEIGVSNHTPAQTDALQAHLGDVALAGDQPEYSLTHLDPLRDGVFDRCMREGVTPLVWSPLAGGSLATGKGVGKELLATMDELAEREGVTRATLAIAFVLAHPARPIALLGTQRADRLRELATATGVSLSRPDVYRLVQDSDGVPLP